MLCRDDSNFDAYQEIKDILTSVDISVDGLVAWARSKCVSEVQTLRSRQFLVLAMYHEIYVPLMEDANSRSNASKITLKALKNSTFKSQMNLTDDEQETLKRIAQGPHDEECSVHDGLTYYFSRPGCDDPKHAAIRAYAVNALSLIFGSKKTACYYYQCCFATERMEDTMGLGGGYGRIAKDCGYQTKFSDGVLTFDDYAPNPAGAKFGEIVSLRAFNNYLVWIAYAWGAWVRMDKSRAMFEAYSWTTTYPEDYRGAGLTLKQQILATIFARSHNFIYILSEDPRLGQAGVSPELYITLCTYHTALKLAECNHQFGFFEKVNHDDALSRQRNCMTYLARIWNRAEASAAAVRERYLETNILKVQTMSAFKVAFSGTAAYISRIPDKAAVDAVINVPLSADADPHLEKCRKIASRILADIDSLSLNLHLPLIVHFYKWMHKHLAYRVSESEKFMKISDAINRIEDPELRTYGLSLLQRFLRAWNTVVEQAGELAGLCPTATEHGESVLPPLDEDVILSRVLSTGEIDDEDNIIRLIGNQINVQNKLINDEDIKDVLSPDSARTLNSSSILAKVLSQDFHVLNISPTMRPQPCGVLVGVVDTLDIYRQMVSAASRPSLEIDSLSFDLRAAALFLLRMLVSGKPVLTLEPRPAYFSFIRDIPPASSQASDIGASATTVLSTFDPVARVTQLTVELRRLMSFPVDDLPPSVEVSTLTRKIRDEATAFRSLAIVASLAEGALAFCIQAGL
jgi:hypothetical protein